MNNQNPTGDLYVIHGLFTTGKPEFLRPVRNVCILVHKKWKPSKLVQYQCGILLNRKPLF
jgi:hypothetical protein